MDQQLVGKVLWWSARKENGVILASNGKEYYFDRSVLNLRKNRKIDRNSLVLFTPRRCENFLAASIVTLPLSKSLNQLERKFEEQKNQLPLPLNL